MMDFHLTKLGCDDYSVLYFFGGQIFAAKYVDQRWLMSLVLSVYM